MLETSITLISVILTLVYKYLTWHFDNWKTRGVNGPKPKILYGNFGRTHNGKCNFVEQLHDIYMTYKHSERFVGIYTSRTPQLFILDPKLALNILITNFASFHDNEALKWTTPQLDRLRFASPMVCTGDTWKEKRLEIGPLSSTNRLRSLYPGMSKIAYKLSDYIQTHIDDVDIKAASRKFAAELMCDFIWGISVNHFREDRPNPIEEAASSMIRQALKCVKYYNQTGAWAWLRKIRPERFFPESADRFFSQLTRDAVKLRSQNPNDRPDVLNYLLQLHNEKQLPETQMVGYTTTVIMDGFETAAIAIAHCLLLLGRNEYAQKKMRQEIVKNLDESSTLSFDRLNGLQYLDQCVHETLRIFPPVPTFFKLCTSPVELDRPDGSKLLLQPGDKAYISIYSFHHDEEFFEQPEEFIPERFDPDIGGTQKYRKRGVFLPFGEGPRICLGMKLVLLEIKIAVADVVRRFEISVCPSTRKDNCVDPSSFLLSLEGGIRLKFKPAK